MVILPRFTDPDQIHESMHRKTGSRAMHLQDSLRGKDSCCSVEPGALEDSAVLDHDAATANIADIRAGVTLDEHHICEFALFDRSELILLLENRGSQECCISKSLQGRNSCLDFQFQFA